MARRGIGRVRCSRPWLLMDSRFSAVESTTIHFIGSVSFSEILEKSATAYDRSFGVGQSRQRLPCQCTCTMPKSGGSQHAAEQYRCSPLVMSLSLADPVLRSTESIAT